MQDSKYIVWKLEEMQKFLSTVNSAGLPMPVLDAVVIRRQDVFAPPALDAYSNAIQCVIEALGQVGQHPDLQEEVWGLMNRLQGIADYFHAQATLAYESDRKLPD